MMVDSAVS